MMTKKYMVRLYNEGSYSNSFFSEQHPVWFIYVSLGKSIKWKWLEVL